MILESSCFFERTARCLPTGYLPQTTVDRQPMASAFDRYRAIKLLLLQATADDGE
eukprot:m.1309197 g.1309197  ORF g.1309197 m.1309197 type:complete len:55 (+) comp24823_c0_seq14:1680-1844(+)